MLAANSQSQKQVLLRTFNNLLSRCDTIHDFTGERAKKVMYAHYNVDNVYRYLNRTKDLQDSKIIEEFRAAGINENRILDDLKLIMRRKDNPNFNFLRSYKNGVDERSCGYEPSVVQFFEFMLGQYDMLDHFYLLESDEVKRTCLIDYTDSLGSRKTMDGILGKICVMELGNTEKVSGASKEEDDAQQDTRQASGIWLNDDNMRQFRADLTDFFAGTKVPRKKLRFVIDASIVSNDTFHDEANAEGIKVALLACSEWDSATKFSKGIVVPSQFYTKSTDERDRVLYGLTSLSARIESTSNNLVVLFDDKPVAGLDKIPREVGNIVDTLVQDKKGGGTGAVPEAIRIINRTLPQNDGAEGVLFDIKRSGDGCQVIQIKQMNSNPYEKYILVTNDHLAFLKARMNAVPVVFTKRNTITGNKRLFLINDTEKGSLDEQARNLIECLGKERDGMREFLENFSDVDIVSVFDRVIFEFDKLKDEMLIRYFGESKVDDGRFDQMILDAISKKKVVRDGLTKQQLIDLHYVSMRIKAYLYDFLAISLDLKTRKAMMTRMFAHYDALVINADNCLEDCKKRFTTAISMPDESFRNESLNEIIKMCRGNLSSFSLIKTRGYGRNLYEWTLENDIEGSLNTKFNEIRQVLSDDNNALALITTKHFLLQDSTIVQNALNFRPLKVYNDIWRFLNTSYKSLSLSSIQPRVSRRSAKTTIDAIGNPASGSSVFLRKANEFIARIYQDYGADDKIPDELRPLLEEVCGMDEFYKMLIMEDNAQNFSLRMVDAGYVSDWMTARSSHQAPLQTGAGSNPQQMLVDDENEDENENTTETYHHPFSQPQQSTKYDSRSKTGDNQKRERDNINHDYNSQQITNQLTGSDQTGPDRKRRKVYEQYFDAYETLNEILYLDFLECFDGLANTRNIFSSIQEYLSLQDVIEKRITQFEAGVVEESVEAILTSAGLSQNYEPNHFGGSSFTNNDIDTMRLPLMMEIMDKCRLLASRSSNSNNNKDWRAAIRSSLNIRDRESIPHAVSEHEWIRFLSKKLVVLPLNDLKLLHVRMTTM
jgi:hypothetical protein